MKSKKVLTYLIMLGIMMTLVFGLSMVAFAASANVTRVDSTTDDGYYNAGDTIHVTVRFSENVYVNTTSGTPRLKLETGVNDKFANYVSGSSSNTLKFDYIVQSGDTSPDLNYVSTNSLEENGGTIQYREWDFSISEGGHYHYYSANVSLPNTADSNSLGSRRNIVIDTTPPSITAPTNVTIASIANPVTVYQHAAYGGYAVNLQQGSYSKTQLIALGMTDNDISSVRVAPGYKVYLYEKNSFGGEVLVKTNDDNNFDNDTVDGVNFNDEVTSIKVTLNIGTATGTDANETTISSNAPIVFTLGDTTVTWTAIDAAGNTNTAAQTVTLVVPDTTAPAFTIQYYANSGFVTSLGDNPRLKEGGYYIKVTSSEPLLNPDTLGSAKISIDAEGTLNDVTDFPLVHVSGNDYIYCRQIQADSLAIGAVLENISITASDLHGNTSTNVDPTNESAKAAYTDTAAPVITGVADGQIYHVNVTPNSTAADIHSVMLTKDAVAVPGYTLGTAITVDADYVLTVADTAGNTVVIHFTVDKTAPIFTIQYYANSGFVTSLGDNPRLKEGGYYIKVTSSEPLLNPDTLGSAKISIDAEGTLNDVTDFPLVHVSGNDYIYCRQIQADSLAIGAVLENISITASDLHGNTSTNVDPTNESAKAAYTDTAAPAITGVTDGGLYNVNVTPNTTATDVGTVTLTKDGVNVGGYALGTSITTDGTYVLTVADTLGNSVTVSFKIDKTSPTVTFTHNHSDLTVRDADTVVITATFSEPVQSAPKIKINPLGGEADIDTPMTGSGTTWTYTWNVPEAHDGAAPATISLATDLAGNNYAGTTSLAFVIDNIAPGAPNQPATTSGVGTIINALEENNGFDVGVVVGTSGAQVGDTMELLLNNDMFPTPLSRVLTSGDISAGAYTFYITHGQLGADGDISIRARVTDVAGNVGTASSALVLTLDIVPPTFDMQYYSDSALNNLLGNNPKLKSGTYYIKLTSNEALSGAPTVSIDAEGTLNDVTNGAATLISGNDYVFVRTITNDALAIGVVLENISISGTDVAGNPTANVDPTNEAAKSAYTDTVAPSITIPSDVTAEANAVLSTVTIGTASGTDVNGPVVITNNAPATFPLGLTVVTWTASDAVGNFSTGTQNVTVVDTTLPVITLPADVTAEANAVLSTVTIGTATATDIFEPVTITNNAPAVFPLGLTVVTWTASDANGKSSTATQNVTIVDTTKPIITAPVDVTAEANAVLSTVAIGTATATDIFMPVMISNDAPAAGFQLGLTVVTWTALDANGNSSTAVQNITVVDTTKPVITVPADVTVEAANPAVTLYQHVGYGGYSVKLAPGKYDMDALMALGMLNDDISSVKVASGYKVYLYQDNFSGMSLVRTSDEPNFCDYGFNDILSSVIITLNIGDASATDIFPVTISNNAPIVYPLGTTVVTWTATDANGNASTGTQNVTLTDTTAPANASVVVNSNDIYAKDTNVTLALSATDNVAVTQMSFSNDDATYGAWVPYSTTAAWTLAAGDGTKTVYAKFKDASGNISAAVNDTIILDTTAPTGTIVINSDDAYTNNANVALTLSAADTLSGMSQMCFSNDDVTYTAWEAYAAAKAWTLATGDGVKIVYVKYKDIAGNESAGITDTITLDTTAPTGTISINSDAAYTNNVNVSLAITATDEFSGVDKMMVSEKADFDGAAWEDFAAARAFTLTSDNGTKTVYIKFKDKIGNEGGLTSDTIILDTVPPTVASLTKDHSDLIVIDADTVVITATFSEDMTVAPRIKIDAPGSSADINAAMTGAGAVWTYSWNVPEGHDGYAYVTVLGNDLAGNAYTGTDNIRFIIDNEKPLAPETPTIDSIIGSIINDQEENTGFDAKVVIKVGITNGAKLGDTLELLVNGHSFSPAQKYVLTADDIEIASCTFTINSGTLGTDGPIALTARITDVAGNVGPQSGALNLTLDTVPPAGSIIINSGDAATNNVSVTLAINAVDATTSVTDMMISNDSSFTGGTWAAYAATAAWTLTSGDGEKTVYIKFRDAGGNESIAFSDTITLDTVAPVAPVLNTSTSPTNAVTVTITGTAEAGSTVTITGGAAAATGTADTEGDFSIDVNLTLNAANILTATATDAAGNVSTASNSVTITQDSISPADATLAADETNPTNKDVTVTITYPSDAAVMQFKIDSTGVYTNYTAPVVLGGNAVIYAKCQDAAGNWSNEVNLAVNNIDKIAPADPTFVGNPTSLTNKDVTVTITYPSDAAAKKYMKTGDADWSDYTGNITITENTTVSAKCADAAGNENVGGVVTYTVTNIDKTAPDTPAITGNPTGATKGNVTITVSFTDTDVAQRLYRIGDSGDYSDYTVPFDVTENTTVYAKAVDSASNESIATYAVTNIDRIAPIVEGVTEGGLYNADVKITFNEGTGTLDTILFASGSLASAEGSHVLVVTDAAGNSTTVHFAIDKTAPVITLNGDAVVVVPVGGTYTDAGAAVTEGLSVTVSGDAVDPATIGIYTIRYNATDPAGNAATEVTRTVNVVPMDGTGLLGEYYDNIDYTNLKMVRTDATVNFNWSTGAPGSVIGADTFSVVWKGYVVPKYSGTYTFYTNNDDGSNLTVNGIELTNDTTLHPPVEKSGTIDLVAGQKYSVLYKFFENTGEAVVSLNWSSANQLKEIIPVTQLYPAEITNVTGVTLLETMTVNMGAAEQLSAVVAPDSATYKGLLWSSDNTAIAAVDSNGMVTGIDGGTANITVTTVEGNKTAVCTVTVRENFTVSASAPGGHGTAVPSPATVTYGGSSTITITPDEGYTIFSVKDGLNDLVPAEGAYIINNVTEDHSVVVTFIQTFAVTASVSGTGGTVSPASQQVMKDYDSAAIVITPDSGYHIATITDNDSALGYTIDHYVIEDVITNHEVVVTFAENEPEKTYYTITVGANGSPGGVYPETQQVEAGQSAHVHLNPNAGCHINVVTDNGTPVSYQTGDGYYYELTNVSANHTILVIFDDDQEGPATYAVAASVSGGNGTISPAEQSITSGNSATITVTPASGYHTASVTDNGTVVSPTPHGNYVISNVTSAHNVVITFEQDQTSGGSGGYDSTFLNSFNNIYNNNNNPPPAAAEEDIFTVETNDEGTEVTLVGTLSADSNGNIVLTKEQTDEALGKFKEVETEKQTATVEGNNVVTKFAIDSLEGSSTQSSITIPSEIVQSIFTNNMDKIEVSSQVASIAVPTAVVETSDAVKIVVDVKVVNAEALTAEQRAVAGDNTVYDFTLSKVQGETTTNISDFSQPVMVAIPYTLKEGQNPNCITVYFLNDNGELENMQGLYDSATQKVRFSTNHFSKFYIKENAVQFVDLEGYDWAKDSIESLASKGIISGVSEDEFAPEANVTRAEFTAMIINMLKLTDNNIKLTFEDVSPSDWFYNSVKIAVKAGIIEGISSEEFSPNANITREDMTTILVRALNMNNQLSMGTADDISFTDKDQIDSYAVESVATAVNYGLVEGYEEDNTFRPLNNTTRAEAAVIIQRAFLLKLNGLD